MAMELTGRHLNQLWEVRAKHALYREDGKWYHQLRDFPGALFDANGFIVFKTREDYLECEDLRIKKDVHVPLGIASISGYVRIMESGGLQILSHQIKEVSSRQSQYSTAKRSKRAKKKPPEIKAPRAIDLAEPKGTERALSQTYRIIRDTEIARWVKYAHEYRCQICGISVQLLGDQLYAEAHHIKPLGDPHNGPDVVENIICVCPNHHAQLDYGAIALDKAKLISVPGHVIGDEYVDYHNTVVCKGAG